MATGKIKTGGTGFDYNQEFDLFGGDGLNQTYGGGPLAANPYVNTATPNLGFGTANTALNGGNPNAAGQVSAIRQQATTANNANPYMASAPGVDAALAESRRQLAPSLLQRNGKAYADTINTMLNAGDNDGARNYYKAIQGQFGFTDDQFSQYAFKGNDAKNGNFTAQELASWRDGTTGNAATTAEPSLIAGSRFNAEQQQAIRDGVNHIAGLINAGKNDEAVAFYKDRQAALGFTDAEMSPFMRLGNDPKQRQFSVDEINNWKGGNKAAAATGTEDTKTSATGGLLNTAATVTPSATAATATAPAATPAAQAQTMQGYERNPYLDEMARGITSQMNENWSRNIAPTIRSGAMAAGGFGGSRQGVVEANALNDMNRSLGQNLTNLYGQDYTQDRARALQKYQADQGFALGNANIGLGYAGLNNQFNIASMGNDTTRRGQDQSFTLGQGNLALGNKNADNNYITQNRQIDNNWTTANRQIDNNWAAQQQNNAVQNAQLDWNIYNGNFNNSLASSRLGLDAYNTLNTNNQNGITAATNINNTPINQNQYFNNQYTQYGGQGKNTTGTQTQGTSSNPWVAAQGVLNGANDVYNAWNRGGGVSTAGSDAKRLTGDYIY